MAFGNRLINISTGGGGGGEVYLAANGVTIIADPSAVSGQEYSLNGVSYLVLANRAALDSAFNSQRNMATTITTRVINFYELFVGLSGWNDAIGNWDTSSVTNMNRMFQETDDFNQNLTWWCVTNIPNEPDRFANKNRDFREINWPDWGECP
jgi:hypothetical protein